MAEGGGSRRGANGTIKKNFAYSVAEGGWGVAPATFYAESEYEVRSLKSLKEKIFLYFGPEVVSLPLLLEGWYFETALGVSHEGTIKMSEIIWY